MRFFWSFALVFVLVGAVVPAWADTVGIAVSSIGSYNQVGLPPSNGTIQFYVPLKSSTSGTYGNKGTASDTCSYPSQCGQGYLNMFLKFAPVQLGANLLSLTFNDLDLRGVNDPYYFLESVQLIIQNQTTLIDEVTDLGVASANYNNQLIQLPVIVGSNPFWLQLHFNSYFGSNTPQGTYQNTSETLRATIAPSAGYGGSTPAVPEPATLSLLGMGLAALGFISRRRK